MSAPELTAASLALGRALAEIALAQCELGMLDERYNSLNRYLDRSRHLILGTLEKMDAIAVLP